MDTLKEYIEMNKKAEDIQKNWNEQIWDAVFYNHPDFEEKGIGKITFIDKQFKKECGKGSIAYYIDVNPVGCYPKEYLIWLPDQDQLQKMVFKNANEGWIRLDYIRLFYEWTKQIDYTHRYLYYSMEQLWLCFLMKEKYNKIWNGENWIEEK